MSDFLLDFISGVGSPWLAFVFCLVDLVFLLSSGEHLHAGLSCKACQMLSLRLDFHIYFLATFKLPALSLALLSISLAVWKL